MNAVLAPRRIVLAAALLVLPSLVRAQDTTRVRTDTTRAAADSARPRADSIALPSTVLPPPVPPRWRYQLDVGFQDMSGNRDLTVYNGTFVVEHRLQDRFILNMKLDTRYGRSNGSESVNYQLARARFDWRPKDPVSPFLGLDVARDIIRKVALRVQLGTGANFNLDPTEGRRTYLSVGFVEDYQQYTAGTVPEIARDVRWMFRGATVRLLSQATRFEAIVRYQPTVHEWEDYLLAGEASIRVSLTRRMGFTTKFEYIRDSRPATGVRPDDRALTAALSFAW